MFDASAAPHFYGYARERALRVCYEMPAAVTCLHTAEHAEARKYSGLYVFIALSGVYRGAIWLRCQKMSAR